MRKGKFLSQAMKERGKIVQQSFSTNSSIPFNRTCFGFFLRWEKFLPEWWTHKTTTKCTNNDENQTPSPHHGVWWWSRVLVTLCLQFTFPNGLTLNKETYIKYLEDSAGLDWEGDCWKTQNLTTGLCGSIFFHRSNKTRS